MTFNVDECLADIWLQTVRLRQGETGCVAPWLAIAAAAQGTKESQLIMSGETGSTKMWSVVVSPCQTAKEKV